MFKVFETGSGKWLQIAGNDTIIFTSESSSATTFTSRELIDADTWFWEFSIYQRTLKAVPLDTNLLPSECDGARITAKRLHAEWVKDLYGEGSFAC